MAFETITDERIHELISMSKIVQNPDAKEVKKPGHIQRNFDLLSEEGSLRFSLYTRQNVKIIRDFSCGLIWLAPNGKTLTLCRYNGPSHLHVNKLEDEELAYCCHIHIATERYLRNRSKGEGFAYFTKKYKILEEALYILSEDCNVSGLPTQTEIEWQ